MGGKAALTLELERLLYLKTIRRGVYGCFEVTIPIGGTERVDYMTYSTSKDFRCYEIKSSREDFNSDAKTSFVGNYGYYVMPIQLYEGVIDRIPAEIGVYVLENGKLACRKRAKRVSLGYPAVVLKDCLLRSLSRELNKQYGIELMHTITN